ncbi:hypothetical protein L1887_50582 [Cichorium endivia]|nr:hypothetical protein L1887_50582 [Cichorium endivia]
MSDKRAACGDRAILRNASSASLPCAVPRRSRIPLASPTHRRARITPALRLSASRATTFPIERKWADKNRLELYILATLRTMQSVDTLAAQSRLGLTAAHPAFLCAAARRDRSCHARGPENVHSDAIRAQGCRTTAAYFDPRERSELNRHGCSERACLR